jgi:hypothetical protein
LWTVMVSQNAKKEAHVDNSARRENFKLSDEAWTRHCMKSELISNSAARPDKSKSMLSAIVDNDASYKRMTTGDGVNIHELLRSL